MRCDIHPKGWLVIAGGADTHNVSSWKCINTTMGSDPQHCQWGRFWSTLPINASFAAARTRFKLISQIGNPKAILEAKLASLKYIDCGTCAILIAANPRKMRLDCKIISQDKAHVLIKAYCGQRALHNQHSQSKAHC